MSLYDKFFGVTDFYLSADDGNAAANVLLMQTEDCRIIWNNDTVILRCAYKNKEKIQQILAEHSLNALNIVSHGFLPTMAKYRARIGIPIGAALFVLMVAFSGSVVWHVDVSGNDRLSEEFIREALSKSGLEIGDSIFSETGDIATRCVAENRELAWMSIQMEGTTAKVHVIEAQLPQSVPKKDGSNLIALTDALITSVEASRGRVAVTPGTVVKKGEILVSGVIEAAHGVVFLEAQGNVWGQVTEVFRQEVSLSAWEKSYCPPKTGELTIKILGFSINIFKSTGNLPPTYDTIYLQDSVRIAGRAFPISYTKTKYVPYVGKQIEMEDEAAAEYAEALLYEKVRASVGDGDVLQMDSEIFFEDGKCIAQCTVTYVKQIAKSVPFDINE